MRWALSAADRCTNQDGEVLRVGVVGSSKHRSLCVVGQAQSLDGEESMFINRVGGYPSSSTLPEMLQK